MPFHLPFLRHEDGSGCLYIGEGERRNVVKAFCGTFAALVLLALGIYFFSMPQLSSWNGIFAAVWMLTALISAVAFVREFSMLMRLNQIRKRWRSSGGKLRRRRHLSSRDTHRYTQLREQERHLN